MVIITPSGYGSFCNLEPSSFETPAESTERERAGYWWGYMRLYWIPWMEKKRGGAGGAGGNAGGIEIGSRTSEAAEDWAAGLELAAGLAADLMTGRR
jgi:hypothetical protein